MNAWEDSWTNAGNQLRDVASEIVPTQLDEASFETISPSDKKLKDSMVKVQDRLGDIRKGVEELAKQVDEIVLEWQTARNASLQLSVDAAVQAYEGLKENLALEGVGDEPTAYGIFVERRREIEHQLKELAGRKEKVRELKDQADECLCNLLEIRRNLTRARREFLDEVLSDNRHVRIKVVPYGAREHVESELRRLLQKEEAHFERDIGEPGGEGLLGELYGDSMEANDMEENLSRVKTRIRQISLGQHDAAAVADRRFVTHIGRLQPEAMDRIDLWFPEDSLEVEYSTTGDGQRFRPIREGSPGQKTAALLAFLLSYGEEPLILDQPEDDLDNHLIYDLIVTQLREVKRHRQVIVITHNANLVVNGDAELVVALAARVGETRKECEGSLQDKPVRDTICEILEGGRKAFDDRYRRIALEYGA